MSDTPRTDAKICLHIITDGAVPELRWMKPLEHEGKLVVPADFARELENELIQTKRELERVTTENKHLRAGKPLGAVIGMMTMMEQDKELTQLRAQLIVTQEQAREAMDLLTTAERLYSTYGLLAQSPECGLWINETRTLIDATRKQVLQ